MKKLSEQVQEELINLSQLAWESVAVEEPEKYSEIGLHEPRYTLYKTLASNKKAHKKRRQSGRGGVKVTQILEDKVGPEVQEIERKIAKSEVASRYPYKELSPAEFQEYSQRLLQAYAQGEVEYFVCDLETQHTKWYHPKAEIVGFALADPQERVGYFIGLSHPELESTQEEKELILRCIKKLWRVIPLVNHNVSFDLHWMVAHTGLKPKEVTILSDTMFQCALVIGRDRLKPGERMSLKDMAKRVLGFDLPWGDLVSESLKSIRLKINRVFFNLKYSVISIYACFDSLVTLELYEAMAKRVKEDGMELIHRKMSDAIISFVEIEQFGVGLDEKLRQHLLEDYKKKIKNVEEAFAMLPTVQEFNEEHKKTLNIGSHDDLRELFFTPKYFCIHPISYTDTGLPSTSEPVMTEISETTKSDFREARKAADLTLRYRSVSKLESTYVSPLPQQMKGDILIPDYNMIGARTGRISSYFHTIPRGNDIKRLFQSQYRTQGGVLLNGDYSQLEVRVIAGLSKDKKLKEAYEQGLDIHRYVASQIHNKPMEKVSSEERSYAKTIVFGILYGKEVYTLSKELGISTEEAQELLDFFFVGFEGVKRFVDDQHVFVKKHGYVPTAWGRRRYIPWIKSSDNWKYGKALRMSQNSPIQGTASDICLDTTHRLQRDIVQRNLHSNVIGTVHDSIETDTYPSELGQMIKLFRYHAVEHCNTHEDFSFMNGVPLEFDFDIGVSWGGAVEINKFIEDNYWQMSGHEKDVADLEKQLSMNYEVVTSDFQKDKADADHVFRTIDPGDMYNFKLKVKNL